MINKIYVTSEEVNLVKEILEENKIEENVLKTLYFVIHSILTVVI